MRGLRVGEILVPYFYYSQSMEIKCKLRGKSCVDDKGVRKYFAAEGLTKDFHRVGLRGEGRGMSKARQVLRLRSGGMQNVASCSLSEGLLAARTTDRGASISALAMYRQL
jgi:hypothetical protein